MGNLTMVENITTHGRPRERGKLRQIDEEELNSLLTYLNKQKYNKPFQSARQAFAWQLKLYIKTYNHSENPFYTTWVEKLEKKTLRQKLFG